MAVKLRGGPAEQTYRVAAMTHGFEYKYIAICKHTRYRLRSSLGRFHRSRVFGSVPVFCLARAIVDGGAVSVSQ